MTEQNPFKLEVVSVRLVKDAPIYSKQPITKPEEAVALVGEYLSEMDRERMCVLNLKTDGTPINCSFVSVGCLSNTLAHPRELFKGSILSNASQMIMLHNHPSGNIHPSKDDILLTNRFISVCDLMGIPLVDHVIVGGGNGEFYSFKENHMIPDNNLYQMTGEQKERYQPQLIHEAGRSR